MHGVDVQSLGDGKAIVLAIDRSKSMHGAPLDPGRRGRPAVPPREAGHRPRRRRHLRLDGARAVPSPASPTDAANALGTLDTDPVEGTALADAVVVSSGLLDQQSLTGRVLILLTDGRDVRSLASWEEAVKAARKANVVVYPIVLGNADRAPLAQLARATGGTVYQSPTAQELAASTTASAPS